MQVLSVSLAQVTRFCGDYREAIVAYKGQHFTDRSLVSGAAVISLTGAPLVRLAFF